MTSEEQPLKPISNPLTEILGDSAPHVREQLDEFYEWMITKGRDQLKHEPLSESMAESYHSRLDQLFRYAIDRLDPDDETVLTFDQADDLLLQLARDEITKRTGEPYSESSKRKFSNTLSKYFEWRHDIGEIPAEWNPRVSFSENNHESADKLNFEERWKIREESMQYGSIPSYYEVSEAERDRINGLVAQRVGKPKSDVTREDWLKSDQSRKVGSLIAVTLEVGLTPIEIQEARINWYDPQRNVFTIPEEFASKERTTDTLPLTENTGDVLSEWIQERRHLEAYDGTTRLWLNNADNPYKSASLCYLVRRLCDEADIPRENRKIVWYSLRHNLGKSMEEVDSLSQASDQLRHSSMETTKGTYAKSSIESRRNTLEKINDRAKRTAEDLDFNPYGDEDASTSVTSSTASQSQTSQASSSYGLL